MRRVTVVTPKLDGFYTDEHGVRVFEGELSLDEILNVTKEPEYAGQACLKLKTDVYFVTFCRDVDDVPEVSEFGSIYWDGREDLTYRVEFVDLVLLVK